MNRFISSLFTATDEQMMWRVKLEDDAQAFGRLMARWERPLQRLCTRMTGDAHRAEDITQAAFARVFARRAGWQPTGRFSTFLWRIAINLCHDELRRNARHSECSLEALEEEGLADLDFAGAEDQSPDAQVEVRERGEAVRDALLRLAPHYREVIVLRHYQDLKFHEIGEVLGIPEGTVKSRMAEGLTQMSRFLKHLNQDTSCNTKTIELRAL